MEKSAFDLGFSWFAYHAGQRISMIRFFVTLMFGIVSAIFYLISTKVWFGSALLSVVLVLVTVVFWQIDVRSRRLIDIGEDIIQEYWTSIGGKPELNPIVQSRTTVSEGLRYRHAFGILFVLGAIFGIAAFVYSLSLWH